MIGQGWANVSWNGSTLKFSDFWWAKSKIFRLLVGQIENFQTFGGSLDLFQFILQLAIKIKFPEKLNDIQS